MRRPLLLITFLVCSSACATATMVRRDARGGRVQLTGSFVPAVSKAKVLMAEQCNGHFAAVEVGDQLEFHCSDAEAPLLAGL